MGLTLKIYLYTIIVSLFICNKALSCEKKVSEFKPFIKLSDNDSYKSVQLFSPKKMNGRLLTMITLKFDEKLIVKLSYDKNLEYSGEYFDSDIDIAANGFEDATLYFNYSSNMGKEEVYSMFGSVIERSLSEIDIR